MFHRNPLAPLNRREMLHRIGAGFGTLGLAGVVAEMGGVQSTVSAASSSVASPLAPKVTHFAPKAKHVIQLFMPGGPSQVDTFDYKPNMKGMDNKVVDVKTFGRGGHRNQGRIVEPRWDFKQYGECGQHVSSLFPHIAGQVDDIAFIHSMHLSLIHI